MLRNLGVLLLILAASPAFAGGETLESRIRPLAEGIKGEVSISVKNLRTGESFAIRPDVPMPTASLIKFPVMIEAYRQGEAKTLDLATPVKLLESDKVPGSGILREHFSEGAILPLRDLIRLMIRDSDNTATNLVLDRIGVGSTAATMEKMGFPETKIHSKVFRRDTSVFPERSKRFGLGSTTSAEMVRLLELLERRELVSRAASEAMLAHLRTCDDRDKFPRFLPAGTKIAFKTGSVDDIRTAAGIIETPQGPVAVCVLCAGSGDGRYEADNAGNRLCAEVARAVFLHFGGIIPPTQSHP